MQLYHTAGRKVCNYLLETTLFTNILTGHCTLGHRTLLVYKISDLYIPLTVFEIQGFKLKNKNDNNNDKKKNWRNRLFAIYPMFVVQFSPNVRCTYILTLAITLRCQKWIITESESLNPKFQMYRHNGPRPHPSLYTKYYHTL